MADQTCGEANSFVYQFLQTTPGLSSIAKLFRKTVKPVSIVFIYIMRRIYYSPRPFGGKFYYVGEGRVMRTGG